jgi:hypothetical protein
MIAELEKAIIESIKTNPDRPPNTPIGESDVPVIIHAALGGFVNVLLEDIADGKEETALNRILDTGHALVQYCQSKILNN